jgi:hypothetical protein
MIELSDDDLVFSFPEVHPEANLRISFHRALRIPDDGREYPLPPGLGSFPLRHIDDFGADVPEPWLRHGGVMMPVYQSEALWMSFSADVVRDRGVEYPFAVKIAAGKINAVTGEAWSDGLATGPQDYLVTPEQPWLDGYCVEKGLIRQFVAMPLGTGYTAEEQITGEAEHGGLQIAVFPMKRAAFERRFPPIRGSRDDLAFGGPVMAMASPEMGLAPGGKMRQEIYEDPFDFADWDPAARSRCFLHLANSLVWRQITGTNPPNPPFTAAEYDRYGMPWFQYYSETPAVSGSGRLAGLQSVAEKARRQGETVLSDNQTISPEHVIALRRGLSAGQVREGEI